MLSQSNQDIIKNIDNFLEAFAKKEEELNRGIAKLEQHLTKNQVFNKWVKTVDLLLEIKTAKQALFDLINSTPIIFQEDIELQAQVQLYLNSVLNETYSVDYIYYFPKFLEKEVEGLPLESKDRDILKSIFVIHEYLKKQKISKEEQLQKAMDNWTKQNRTASVKESVNMLRNLKKQIFDYQNLQFEELINQLMQVHQLDNKQDAIILLKKGVQILISLHTQLSEKIAKEIENEVTAYRKIEISLDNMLEK